MAMTFDMGGLQRGLNPPRNPGAVAIPALAPQTREDYVAQNGIDVPAIQPTVSYGAAVPAITPIATYAGLPTPATAPAMSIPSMMPPAPAVEGTHTQYESSPIDSPFARDLKFSDMLSKAYGIVGLPKQAEEARALHAQLLMTDTAHKADVAARAFVAGDIKKTIDLFNHSSPDGNQITHYAKNPDGTYTFTSQDGTKQRMTEEQIGANLATFKDPNHLGKMMEARAKSVFDTQKLVQTENMRQRGRIQLERIKSEHAAEQLLAGKQLDHASRMAIAKFQAENGPSRVGLDALGKPVSIASHNGKVFLFNESKGLDGKPALTLTEMQMPGVSPNGTFLNTGAIGIPIDQRYARP